MFSVSWRRKYCKFPKWSVYGFLGITFWLDTFRIRWIKRYHSNFPEMTKYVLKVRFNKPWLSSGILKFIMTKTEYFILFKLIWRIMRHLRPGVLNLFLTADRSALDNFTADHPGPAVKLSSGGEGGVLRKQFSDFCFFELLSKIVVIFSLKWP